MAESIFFYIFAIVSIISALFVIISRDPVRSAMSLVVCFLQIAALYVLLRSPFLAVVQVFVYVGAIVVFFLFVIMIMDIRTVKLTEVLHHQYIAAPVLAVFLLMEIGLFIAKGSFWTGRGEFDEAKLMEVGSVEALGTFLFTNTLFPFEVVSVILLVALIGGVVLTVGRKK